MRKQLLYCFAGAIIEIVLTWLQNSGYLIRSAITDLEKIKVNQEEGKKGSI